MFGDHLEGIFGKYLVYPPLAALLGHPVQNNKFALIRKIYLQTLVELMFRYHKIFCLHPVTALLRHPVQKYFYIFCFNQKILFTPPVLKYFVQPKRRKVKISHMECWVSK